MICRLRSIEARAEHCSTEVWFGWRNEDDGIELSVEGMPSQASGRAAEAEVSMRLRMPHMI